MRIKTYKLTPLPKPKKKRPESDWVICTPPVLSSFTLGEDQGYYESIINHKPNHEDEDDEDDYDEEEE